MKNRVEEILKSRGQTVYSFAKEHNLSTARVYYWCKVTEPKEGLDLLIKNYLNVDKYIW